MTDDNHKLRDRVDTVADRITFTNEIQKLLDDGSLVMLAVFLYRPADDALVVVRSGKLTIEEVDAMLRGFDFPRGKYEPSKMGDDL